MIGRLDRLGSVALAAVLGVVVVGCGGPPPSSPRASAVGSSFGPARAQATDDHFQLVFELSRTTWHTTEAVTGTATLTLVAPGSMTVWGSGSGLLGFEFAQVGGERTIGWLRTADCRPGQIEASTPLVSTITNPYGTDPRQCLPVFLALLGEPIEHAPPDLDVARADHSLRITRWLPEVSSLVSDVTPFLDALVMAWRQGSRDGCIHPQPIGCKRTLTSSPAD